MSSWLIALDIIFRRARTWFLECAADDHSKWRKVCYQTIKRCLYHKYDLRAKLKTKNYERDSRQI